MAKDLVYTNGVIAAREKGLLKNKIFKLCEGSAEEALRALTESGFARGTEVNSPYEYEKLVAADEAAIDSFIREYSPSRAEAEYLLANRDFHNAKALIKAKYAGGEAQKMLAPEGMLSIELISECVNTGKFKPLGKQLAAAAGQAAALFSEENKGQASGAEIGIIFEKALYAHLFNACAKNGLLKKLLAAKADMTNILTAMRSSQAEFAQKCYLPGGKLTQKQLDGLFDEVPERAACSLNSTPYADFVKSCFEAKAAGLPCAQAEKVCESYETQFLSERKYELQREQPFLYYVFRRRAENANVRILFVCLLAGMKEGEIKNRLRTV